MDAKQLLEKFPLSANVLKEWFSQELIKSCEEDENLPLEFKEFILEKGVEIDRVAELIDINARVLFDVLDANKIYIDIYPNFKNGSFIGFHTSINEHEEIGPFLNRRIAEKSIIEEAFYILEGQETNLRKDIQNETGETITDTIHE